MKYGIQYNIDFKILDKATQKYTETFNCGNPSIDAYFREGAINDSSSVTYLFIDTDSDELISCVTLSCSAIFTDTDIENTFSTILSAMEIKYFAVDEEYQHIPYERNAKLSLSYYIFVFMLNYMMEMSHNKIGASKVVLYAVPTAVNFYKRCKFKEFGSTMYGDEGYYVSECIPMYYDLND